MARKLWTGNGTAARFKAPDSQSDIRLLRLAERMRLAEHALQAAMDEVAGAERRLSEMRGKAGSRQPTWYRAAAQRERIAGVAVEDIYKAIARARARTWSGLAIKVTVLATLYGEALDRHPDQSDMVSVMIHSLFKDVRG
jgi:hypothetical protein